jgi:putative ABC transport system permease protein
MTFFQFALNNVKRNARVYLAYFLSSVFTIMVFFSFAVNLFHPIIVSKRGGAVELIMGQTELAILVFSFLFIFISVNAFLKVRSKEFGILMVLGMYKKQLRRLVFLENMIIGCLAIIVGIIIGLVFSKFLLMLLSSILSYDSLSFYFPYKAILLTTVFFTLIFLGISALTPLIIRTNNIITLLKGTKRPNREIKFSIIQSIAAVLLLGIGYFMALSQQLYDINPFLDRIVLFIEKIQYAEVILTTSVVIGTYLFFSQLSIFVLHWLKRNRSFYMNRTNMLWISDLIYRIRDNTRMLFLVTILSAIAFTAITGVYALSSLVKDESLKDNPFALTYTSYSSNDNEQQQIKTIDEMLESYGLKYKKYKSEVIKQVSNDNHTVHIIKQSDYNNRASAIGLEQVDLDKDQALLVPVYVRFDPKRDKTLSQKNIALDNGAINLEVVGIAPKVIFYSGLFRNLVVVNDEIYNKITQTSQ